MSRPTIEDIRAAAERIAPYAHKTPVLRSTYIDDLVGAGVFFKCENFQKVGAFKFRGACNAVFSLSDDECAAGVATHSSGNHAQALALAAKMRNIPAHIVMPRTAPAVKQAAVRDYGTHITLCAPTLQDREDTTAEIVAITGSVFIHPYDDERIISGQGTTTLELLEECGSLDTILVPIGGGGLCSGTAIAANALQPESRVIAVEPEGADDVYQSFATGDYRLPENPASVADGLLTGLGTITYPIVRELVKSVYCVSDEEIISAMRIIWERMKLVVEPSGATPLAGLIRNREQHNGQRIGIILSGGNVDLDKQYW